jgi:hypothetical protein
MVSVWERYRSDDEKRVEIGKNGGVWRLNSKL